MRIAQISPLWERVPPPGYGGTEAVVHTLTEGLVAQGHEVVLFASGDSLTSAELRSTYSRSLRTATEIADPLPYEWLHIATALAAGEEFDLIHNHSGELPMAMSALVAAPMLTTMHCLLTPDTRQVWERYLGHFNVISRAQWRTLPASVRQRNHVGVIYNAIDVASFPFQTRKGEHLLFLSRISPEKGAHTAIAVARRLGLPLVLAGKVDRVDRAYYESTVKPLIDGDQIRYLGEATREEAKSLHANAMALLLPIDWEEPFGLVIPEAMATGTPVISFRRGAADELIVDGETGFLVEPGDLDGMVAAVRKLDRIDPHACRRHVEQNFDIPQMVAGYLDAYERVLYAVRRRGPLLAVPNLPQTEASEGGNKPVERLREAS